MDALTAILTRTSSPRVTDEVPGETEIENILKAALRAPDHALLRPWRFLIIRGDARASLADAFVKAQLGDEPDLTEGAITKVRSKPLRAPLIIVVVARITEHPSVPEVEQIVSAGAAAQNMLIAAHAQSIGAMWRTGAMAYHPVVHRELGLGPNERIVGYLYLGKNANVKQRSIPALDINHFVEEWPAKTE